MTHDKDRACGTRTPGHTYAVTQTTTAGTIIHTDPITKKEREDPIDAFLFCPPFELDPELVLSDQGITQILRPDGTLVYDNYDVVGASFYPYFPIFFEEGKAMGFSRKVQGIDFRLLSRESLHIIVHHKGLLDDYDPLFDDRLHLYRCPQDHEWHKNNEKIDFCTALLWEAMDDPKAGREFTYYAPANDGVLSRYMFKAARPPADYKPVWRTAAMMMLPITLLEVINDEIGGTHKRALDLIKSSKTQVPYRVVEE